MARICYVTPEYPSVGRGDVGRSLHELCARIEWPSLILTRKTTTPPLPPPTHARLVQVGFRDVVLGERRGLGLRWMMLRKACGYLSFFLRSRRELAAFRPHVVHLETPMPLLHALYARYWLGARVVVVFVGSDLLRIEQSRFLRRLVGRAHVLFTVSPSMRAPLEDLIPGVPVVVVRPAVDRALFVPAACARRKQLLVPASFTWEKGHGILLAAFAQLVRRHPGVELVLAGSGYLEARIRNDVRRRGLAEAVRFLGQVPRAELVVHYQTSLVCVLASLSEGYPRVLLESVACGTPIVTSRVGGAQEIAEQVGLVVEPGDPEGLAAALERLLTDHELWSRLARACAAAAERHSLDARAALAREVYERLVTPVC